MENLTSAKISTKKISSKLFCLIICISVGGLKIIVTSTIHQVKHNTQDISVIILHNAIMCICTSYFSSYNCPDTSILKTKA